MAMKTTNVVHTRLALLLCWLLQAQGLDLTDPSSISCGSASRTIKIGFLGPYNSPVDDTSNNQNALPVGFLAALRRMEGDGAEICRGGSVSFEYRILDSSTIGTNNKVRALKHATDFFKCPVTANQQQCTVDDSIGYDVDIIIADWYSSTVATIGMVAEIYGKPMLAYGATSDRLSDKSDFPWVSRVIPPDRYQAPALARVVQEFGWRHVGIISGDGNYATNFASSFGLECISLGITVEDRHTFAEGNRDNFAMGEILGAMKESGVKIIVLISVGLSDTLHVLRNAAALGMTGRGYVWIGGDGYISVDNFKKSSELLDYLDGSIGIFHYVDDQSNVLNSIFSNQRWLSGGTTDGTWNHPLSFSRPYDPWALYVWDATFFAIRTLASLSDACFRSGACVLQNLRSNTMNGATGAIQLDRRTGDRLNGKYNVYNIRNSGTDALVEIGVVDDTYGATLYNTEAIIWPGNDPAQPSDGDWDEEIDDTTAIAVGVVLGTLGLIAVGLFIPYRRNLRRKANKAKAKAMEAERALEEFKKQTEGVREVTQDWKGNEFVAIDLSGTGSSMYNVSTGKVIWLTDSTCSLSEPYGDCVLATIENSIACDIEKAYLTNTTDKNKQSVVIDLKSQAPIAGTAKWFWFEDSAKLHLHDSSKVLSPNWVEYLPSVSDFIETQYKQNLAGNGPNSFHINLQGKATNAHTGSKFFIDLEKMLQVNTQSGFSRKIFRLDQPTSLFNSIKVHFDLFQLSISGTHTFPLYRVILHDDGDYELTYKDTTLSGNDDQAMNVDRNIAELFSNISDRNEATILPKNLQDENILPLRKGQLIEISKRNPDDWWFGSILYEEASDGADHIGKSGWFPAMCVDKPQARTLQSFQASLGGNADQLKPPEEWEQQADRSVAALYNIELSSAEAQPLLSAFNATCGRSCHVLNMKRIQNVSLWQSYAVKRLQIVDRDGSSDTQKIGSDRMEIPIAFHGSDAQTVPKIIQQGFNRSFCGKNAVMYGKGVYFARNASYSASTTYSRPDDSGVQRMFICRVLCGVYCLGTNGALTPAVLDATTNRLYDSTVDKLSQPNMWVTYHDAQAYPAYLVEFRRT